MGDFLGDDQGQIKNHFDFFFWFQPLGDPFGDPLLDPFWTHFGPIWTKKRVKVSTVWSLWVTKEAITRSQMASGCRK